MRCFGSPTKDEEEEQAQRPRAAAPSPFANSNKDRPRRSLSRAGSTPAPLSIPPRSRASLQASLPLSSSPATGPPGSGASATSTPPAHSPAPAGASPQIAKSGLGSSRRARSARGLAADPPPENQQQGSSAHPLPSPESRLRHSNSGSPSSAGPPTPPFAPPPPPAAAGAADGGRGRAAASRSAPTTPSPVPPLKSPLGLAGPGTPGSSLHGAPSACSGQAPKKGGARSAAAAFSPSSVAAFPTCSSTSSASDGNVEALSPLPPAEGNGAGPGSSSGGSRSSGAIKITGVHNNNSNNNNNKNSYNKGSAGSSTSSAGAGAGGSGSGKNPARGRNLPLWGRSTSLRNGESGSSVASGGSSAAAGSSSSRDAEGPGEARPQRGASTSSPPLVHPKAPASTPSLASGAASAGSDSTMGCVRSRSIGHMAGAGKGAARQGALASLSPAAVSPEDHPQKAPEAHSDAHENGHTARKEAAAAGAHKEGQEVVGAPQQAPGPGQGQGQGQGQEQGQGHQVLALQQVPGQGQGQGHQVLAFSAAELAEATDQFSEACLIGEGGFGPVYQGWMPVWRLEGIGFDVEATTRNGPFVAVAIKVLKEDSQQGDREWLAEVSFLGHLRHASLVRLLGFCCEGRQRMLVYEYMPQGSLEFLLFAPSEPPSPTAEAGAGASGALEAETRALTWHERINIALGAARGLAFLHEEADSQVIYRDFKTSNILLDGNLDAKLSDFGLARNGPQGEQSHVSTRIVGTVGYAAPEYVLTGHLTTKSDIWAFGVVLLELLSGRLAMDKRRPKDEQNLVEWAEPFLDQPSKLYRMMDPALRGRFSVKGAQVAAAVARRCLHRRPKLRPKMSHVVEALLPVLELHDMAGIVVPPSPSGACAFAKAASPSPRQGHANGHARGSPEGERSPRTPSPKAVLLVASPAAAAATAASS